VPLYKVFLARILKNSDDDDFQAALRQAAIQAPDRVSLYEFLNYSETPAEGLEAVVAKAGSSVDQQEAAPTGTAGTAQSGDPEETAQVAEDISGDTATTEDVSVELPEAERGEATEAGTGHALAADQIPVVEETPTTADQDRMDTLRQLAAEVAEAKTATEREPETPELMKTTAGSGIAMDEKHTFTEWLEILEGHAEPAANSATAGDEGPEVSEEDEVAILETQIDEYSTAQRYEADIQREASDMEEHDLEARLEPDEREAVRDLADKSLELDTGLVTETLARLMLMQGKKTESIALYEQLRLKYPEKSDYFAAQIEAIKAK
jgi:hypothetical protein